jgi:hypothetical protein
MVHTNPEFETSNLILDFEFDQHLESHKHVINIIMWFRDMGCYNPPPRSHNLATAYVETGPKLIKHRVGSPFMKMSVNCDVIGTWRTRS